MTTIKKNSPISVFVRAARDALALTQEQFAESLGKTKGNISAWENGRHEPSYTVIDEIAKRSGVAPPGAPAAPLKLVAPTDSLGYEIIALNQLYIDSTASGRARIMESALDVDKLPISQRRYTGNK